MNDLDALEAIAKAASPGPWGRATSATRNWALVLSASGTADECLVSQSADDDDAEYIATFDPLTVRSIIDELRNARYAIREAIEAHKPFEWSFGYGVMRSCGLCAELGGTEAQTSWPCETVRILNNFDKERHTS